MMKRTVRTVCTLTAVAGVAIGLFAILPDQTAGAPSSPTAGARYLSPLAIIADKAGKTLYVAEATGHQVGVVDVASGTVTRNLPLSGEATGWWGASSRRRHRRLCRRHPVSVARRRFWLRPIGAPTL